MLCQQYQNHKVLNMATNNQFLTANCNGEHLWGLTERKWTTWHTWNSFTGKNEPQNVTIVVFQAANFLTFENMLRWILETSISEKLKDKNLKLCMWLSDSLCNTLEGYPWEPVCICFDSCQNASCYLSLPISPCISLNKAVIFHTMQYPKTICYGQFIKQK